MGKELKSGTPDLGNNQPVSESILWRLVAGYVLSISRASETSPAITLQ